MKRMHSMIALLVILAVLAGLYAHLPIPGEMNRQSRKLLKFRNWMRIKLHKLF